MVWTSADLKFAECGLPVQRIARSRFYACCVNGLNPPRIRGACAGFVSEVGQSALLVLLLVL